MEALETKRLLIRRFRYKEKENIFALLRDPPSKYYARWKVGSLKDDQMKDDLLMEAVLRWLAIELKDDCRLIGLIRCGRGLDKEFKVQWMLKSGCPGRGYAFEAANALISYLFQRRDARRIHTYAEAEDTRMQRICEKLGHAQGRTVQGNHLVRRQ